MDSNYVKFSVGGVLAQALASLTSHTLPIDAVNDIIDPDAPPPLSEPTAYDLDGNPIRPSAASGRGSSSQQQSRRESTSAGNAGASAAELKHQTFSQARIVHPQALLPPLIDPVEYVSRYLLHHESSTQMLLESRAREAGLRGMVGTVQARERAVHDGKRKLVEAINERGEAMRRKEEEDEAKRKREEEEEEGKAAAELAAGGAGHVPTTSLTDADGAIVVSPPAAGGADGAAGEAGAVGGLVGGGGTGTATPEGGTTSPQPDGELRDGSMQEVEEEDEEEKSEGEFED
ncbi:hypothetical protein HK101_011459 [Irineochytrium annulatum]|nr:hypothetical protein HK101_011459 [Irineochytrium annulatum]